MSLAPYIPAWQDLRPFAAELWLIATAVAVLLTAFVVRRPNTAAATVAFVGLAAAVVATWVVGPVDAAAGRFAPMLAADGAAMIWKSILLLFTAGAVLLWFGSGRHVVREGDAPEYFLLLVTATLGMSLMGSACNLLLVFVAVEMASLPSYVLAGFRKHHRPGAEASLKYVLFGAAATGVMAWGLSLVYASCGTLNLYEVAGAAGVAEQIHRGGPAAGPMLWVGGLAVLAGLAFKIAAVPLHLWCPDVFEGATVDVTTFLSVASKGAGLVLLMRLAVAVAEPGGFAPTPFATAVAVALGVVGALSATVGNTAAYVQANLKRLLAYSSIAQAGYMLCAAALIVRGTGSTATAHDFAAVGLRAVLFYLAVYLFMNLGAFAVVAAVGRQTGGETIDRFRGLGRRSPRLAACMTLCCLSLIGVPPLAGFTAKFNVLQALADNGGWWWALVAAVAINTLLSVYYYARVIKAMYLEDDGHPPLGPTGVAGVLSLASAAALVLLFVGSQGLSQWTADHGRFRSAGEPMQTVDRLATR